MTPSRSEPRQGNASDAPPVRHVAARAPTRIDFGGGWTDVPPYPERDGGFVCNVAISRYARVSFVPTAGTSDEPLARAALSHAGTAGTIAIENDFPTGAGLGGSSAAGVAIQAAFSAFRGEALDPETLARRSRAVEVDELGVAGGWQDHYAAAYGGALALDFGETTRASRIPLAAATLALLERRCLLLHTGQSRISGENITAVLDAYAGRDRRVCAALTRMASLARSMAEAVRAGDMEALGELVAEHWVHQRSLHPAITTERIDAIVERAAAAGAIGTKALGASGGGCVVIITPDDPAPVARAVEALGTLLPFRVDRHGATIEDGL